MPKKHTTRADKYAVYNLKERRDGIKKVTGILAEQGKAYEDHVRQRANEVVIRKMAQHEAEEKSGIQIDDREMAMYTPNEVAEIKEDEEVTAQPIKDDE